MKVLKNYILNSSYQLLLVIIPIITIPYISRVLGTEGVGLNAFTNAIIQYFILAGSIGVTTYGNREIAYHQKDKTKRSQLFWEISFLRFITIGLALIAFAVFLLIVHSHIEIYLLQGIAILAAALDISWYFMGMENFKRTVTRNFIVSIISLICIFVFVHHASDLPIYVAIVAGSAFIGNASLWPYLKTEVVKPKFKTLNIKKHLQPTLMLFLPQIAVQVYTIVNKTMIGMFDSVTAAGFFAQSDALIKVTLALVTSLGVVMLPRMSNMHASGDTAGVKKMLTKSFDMMTGMAIPIMFGLMAISLKFAPFFLGKNFKEVGLLMMLETPIILFIAWSNVLGIQYLLPLNRMREFTTSVTLGAVVNIIINFIVIPIWGVVGAMGATIIAELTVTAYQMYILRHDFEINQLIFNSWKYWISGLMMFIAVFYLSMQEKMSLHNFMIQIAVGVIIYLGLNVILKSNLFLEVKKVLVKK